MSVRLLDRIPESARVYGQALGGGRPTALSSEVRVPSFAGYADAGSDGAGRPPMVEPAAPRRVEGDAAPPARPDGEGPARDPGARADAGAAATRAAGAKPAAAATVEPGATQTAGSAPTAAQAPALTAVPIPLRHEALARVILARARAMPEAGRVELRFALEPRELGTVRVRMEAHGQSLRVEIVTSSLVAADTLQNGLARLSSQLNEAGFRDPQITLAPDSSADPGHHPGRQAESGESQGRPSMRTHPRAAGTTADPATSPTRSWTFEGRRLDRTA